jgi:transposase
LLSLSTIRQHFNSGFNSVLSLIEDLEQQIESLTLANQSPNHLQHLEQTIAHQKYEIRRLTETIDHKTEEIFKLHQSRLQFQNDLQLRLTEVRRTNRHLRTRIRELEYLLAAGDASAPKLDSHNSNLPPSLDAPWNNPPRTRSLRTRSGRPPGGVPGHRGFTLRQVSEPDLVIIQRVNVCQHCHHSLVQIEPIRLHKRQIFDIENGSLFVTEHQAEVRFCPLCRKISKGHFPDHLKAPVQYGSSVFSRIVYLNQYQLLPVAQTAESMNDLFRCPVSLATIQRATRFCGQTLFRFEYLLKAALRQSEVMGVDETGININGENHWVHVARSENLTYLAFHTKRGGIAFEEIGIINEFSGVLVRDGFTAYQKYEQCRHGLCNAHLLRDLTFIGEAFPDNKNWTDTFAKHLLEIKSAVKNARSELLTTLDDSLQTDFLVVMTPFWLMPSKPSEVLPLEKTRFFRLRVCTED